MSCKNSKTACCTPGFSLIEIIVAVTIMAVLAAAIVPVMFNKLDQARYERIFDDLQAIYEASMGDANEDYFGFVGDMGVLPDSVEELLDGIGLGGEWNGPYLSFAGGAKFTDVYANSYVIDTSPIRIRSYGPDGTDNSGTGDDISYPDNPLSSFKGDLEVQVYINGRLITDAAIDQVTAGLAYANDGTADNMAMTFNSTDQQFELPSFVHQGKHVLTVTASLGAGTTQREVVTILPGATTSSQIEFSDSAYMTRLDTDLNGNGIPDRKEDLDGDGIPDSMDPDIDGDGTPNAIDADSLDPTVGQLPGTTSPQVTAITPSYGSQGDNGLLLTIDGAYFVDGATVSFSGTGITVNTIPATFVSAAQLTVYVDISGSAATGYRNVTVTNPDGGSGTGSSMFEVLVGGANPSPLISLVSPDNADQGETNLTVTLQGQNFLTGPTVTFSNGNITVNNTTFVNSTQVDVNITIPGSAATGAGTVRLTNTDAKFDEATFTVNQIVPNISSINPNSERYNRNNVWITVTGSNFLSGFSASTSGSPLTVDQISFTSSTEVMVRVDCGFTFTTVIRDLIITNPGGASDSAPFTITGFF
ncbi:MAG: prepilin-type N-terminal cleavage/methylation domain-containing protein [Candidatus Glassbacteria bacterium]|nr:prepilin-type N-terminal cleavage/methylation domain-containing protein [Candidatus Glassbacteria bacterium]